MGIFSSISKGTANDEMVNKTAIKTIYIQDTELAALKHLLYFENTLFVPTTLPSPLDSRWNPHIPHGIKQFFSNVVASYGLHGIQVESRWNPTQFYNSDYSDVIYHSRAHFELSLEKVVYYQL